MLFEALVSDGKLVVGECARLVDDVRLLASAVGDDATLALTPCLLGMELDEDDDTGPSVSVNDWVNATPAPAMEVHWPVFQLGIAAPFAANNALVGISTTLVGEYALSTNRRLLQSLLNTIKQLKR